MTKEYPLYSVDASTGVTYIGVDKSPNVDSGEERHLTHSKTIETRTLFDNEVSYDVAAKKIWSEGLSPESVVLNKRNIVATHHLGIVTMKGD